MFGFQRKRKLHSRPAPADNRPPQTSPEPSSPGLDERLNWFRRQFEDCFDVTCHELALEPNHVRCALLYIAGMIDRDLLLKTVLAPLTNPGFAATPAELFHKVMDLKSFPSSSCIITSKLAEAVQYILDGQVIMLLDQEERVLIFPFCSYEKRSISEAQNEVVIRGPREAFVEDLQINVTLIRRRLKSTALKLEHLRIGELTHTNVVLAYVDQVCEPELIEEVKRRLSEIRIDGVLESSYLEELIEDNMYSPFPQMQNTERPDIAAAALLEGRIVLLTDGTPIAIMAPVTFPVFFQSPEDYYQRYYATTWIRWIRYLFMMVSMFFPSLYIALTTFHPELIPASLLFSIAASREPVPFPAIAEALIMEISFEALREASIRIPSAIGQAVSILGTLVIGEAAVRAGIVSAPMVIIVSLTGISSFIVPSFSLGLTLRLLRFPVMLLAASFGLVGLSIGIFLILLHLVSLRSFGRPYLAPLTPMNTGDWKDILVRAPWRMMTRRPGLFSQAESRRLRVLSRGPHGEDEGD